MDQADNVIKETEVTNEIEVQKAGAEDDFELKVLDCGTNYQMESVATTCMSCFCGSGCFCGVA